MAWRQNLYSKIFCQGKILTDAFHLVGQSIDGHHPRPPAVAIATGERENCDGLLA